MDNNEYNAMNNSINITPINNSQKEEKQKKPHNTFGIILLIILGLITFTSVAAITFLSFNTIELHSIVTKHYSDIQGKWIDTTGNNLFIIKNDGTYEWYKNYNVDKNQYISGSIKVMKGYKVLDELDLTKSKISNMVDLVDEFSTEDIYYMRLFTSEDNIKSGYYKMLLVNTDREMAIYDYNSDLVYYFVKSN